MAAIIAFPNGGTLVTVDKIGLIGLGLLGSAIAKRLLGAGFAVFGFDLDEGSRNRLEVNGGQVTTTASDIAETCRYIILSLPDSRVVDVVLRDIEAKLRDHSFIMDTTTGDPDDTEGFGRRLADLGHFYLDTTIGGSSRQVEAGEAIVIVGGDSGSYDECSDILHVIGKQVFHVGPCGSGSRMKLVLNLVLGLNRAVLAEGLTFASRYGLSPEQTLDILKAGPAYSRVMDVKGRKMLAREFEPEARLSQHLKDVRLILAAGERCGAKLPLSAVHRQLLAEAEARGLGGADNSAIIGSFE